MTDCPDTTTPWGQICGTCGQRLPVAKPWSAGRPCSKTALDRGHGWDGRPAVEHGPGSRNRWNGYGTGLVRAASIVELTAGAHKLTDRQNEILRIIAKHGGSQAAAARELGVAAATISATLARMRKKGVLTERLVR